MSFLSRFKRRVVSPAQRRSIVASAIEGLECRRLLANPVVGIAAFDATAAEASLESGKFRLTRSVTTGSLTVDFVLSGSAENGVDFDTVTESVTFASGAATADVTIKPKEDTDYEGAETVIATLAESGDYDVDAAKDDATINLADNDKPVVSFLLAEQDAQEGDEDVAAPGLIVISRTGNTALPLTVKFTITGTATNGTDYDTMTTSVVIPADEEQVTVTLTPKDDSTLEGKETAIFTITADAAYTAGTINKITVKIGDDERPTISLAATDATATEGSTTDTAKFTLTRNGPTTESLTVPYTVSGTAVNSTDYLVLNQNAIFPIGKATVDVVVTTVQDTNVEGAETVTITLGTRDDLMGAMYLLDDTKKTATVTINDDDKPTVSLTASDASAVEVGKNTNASFTLTRTGATTGELAVPVVITGTATKGSDYKTIATSITIPAGKSSGLVKIKAKDDALLEGSETVILTLGTGAFLAAADAKTATVTIADDEVPDVGVTATDASQIEGVATDKSIFTFTRNGPTTTDLVVNFSRASTASSGVDFEALPTSVTIPVGKASATVEVKSINDDTIEGFETVRLFVSDSANYDVDPFNADAMIKILDDEKPEVTVEVQNENAYEDPLGGGQGLFLVRRNGGAQEELTVPITITGTGKNGVDYEKIDTTVFFPVGTYTKGVFVTPIVNDAINGERTVILTAKAGTTYKFRSNNDATSGTINIIDDEKPTVTLTGTKTTASEPAVKGTVTIARNGPTTAALPVKIKLTGTATSGDDYTAVETTVTIPAGKASIAVDVTPKDDDALEGNETVIVTLDSPIGNYDLNNDKKSATIVIADADKPVVSVVATDETLKENDHSTGELTFARTGPTTEALDIQYTVTGSAKTGTDTAETLTGIFRLAAGKASDTFELTPIQDTDYEGDETIIVTLRASPTIYTIDDAKKAATATITDDDKPLVIIAATKATAKENGGTKDPITFTLTRSGITTAALDVDLVTTGSTASDADFVAIPETVTFPIGKTSVVVTLVPKDDSTYEGTEALKLGIDFSGDKPYRVGDTNDVRAATARLTDNEIPTISLVATDDTADEEGTATGYFTVSRDVAGDDDLTVNLSLTGNAKNGKDYTKIGKTVVIPAGETAVRVYVAPKNDTTVEGNETVSLALATGTGYLVSASTKADDITIADNDLPTLSVAAGDDGVDENDTVGTWFRITREGTTLNYATTVKFTLGGTADADRYTLTDEDGNTVTTSVVIPIGESYVDLQLTPVDNDAADGDVFVRLTIGTDPLYEVDDAADRSDIDIIDDE